MNAYALLDRIGFRPFVRFLYRVEVTGREHVPATGACILAANHESIADPFILGVATTREIRFMAKIELFGNPVVGAVMRSLGTFPVDRGSGDHAAVGEAARLLARGEVLGIFPQGTSKQHLERRWHRGAARLALVSGAPVVPVRMTGTRALPFRTRVRIEIRAPIHVETAQPTVAAARALTARIQEAVGA